MTNRQLVMAAIALLVLVIATQGCDALDAQEKRQLKAEASGGEMTGTSGDEVFVGGPGEDLMNGNGGNDEFHPGGPSGAMVFGGSGNDIYFFNKTDGRLLIRDSGGNDELRLGPGIRTSDVKVEERGGQIQLVITGAEAKPPLGDLERWNVTFMRDGNSDADQVERITFTDGTTRDYAETARRKVKIY